MPELELPAEEDPAPFDFSVLGEVPWLRYSRLGDPSAALISKGW